MPIGVTDLIALDKHDGVGSAVGNRAGDAGIFDEHQRVGGVGGSGPSVERAGIADLFRQIADVGRAEERGDEYAVGAHLRTGPLDDVRGDVAALAIDGRVPKILLLDVREQEIEDGAFVGAVGREVAGERREGAESVVDVVRAEGELSHFVGAGRAAGGFAGGLNGR